MPEVTTLTPEEFKEFFEIQQRPDDECSRHERRRRRELRGRINAEMEERSGMSLGTLLEGWFSSWAQYKREAHFEVSKPGERDNNRSG
jgi:hypothetical protein